MTWARRIVPACEELAAALTAAGVPATLERGKVELGGAWVRPDTAARATLRGGTCRASVFLVVSQQADAEGLRDLVEVLEKALDVIEPDEDVDTTVLLSVRGNNLPAFRLQVDLDLEEE